MDRLTELLIQKKEYNEIKRGLDKGACLQTWEGMAYARTITQLVLIELEIENIKKTTLVMWPQ